MSLRLNGCRFSYKRVPVFAGLSVEFSSGATVLLGPNGAGKSTLLGLAASFLFPAEGAVTYRDLDPSRRRDRSAYRRAVGWMPQRIVPIPGLTVREQVSYAGWLKGMSRAEAWERSARALGRVDLSDLADRRATQLSGGQLRRVGLAQTLVHDAEVILMDEPTAGLDLQQRETFRLVVQRVSRNTDVVVSTHQTEDLTSLYTSVVVLEAGAVRFSGPTERFTELGVGDVGQAYMSLVAKER